jgi:hypothetical protein
MSPNHPEMQREVRERPLSERERSDLLQAACRFAAELEASRLKSGMPKSKPIPWPSSTWKFLARHAHA